MHAYHAVVYIWNSNTINVYFNFYEIMNLCYWSEVWQTVY